jgi:hypothetical protein
MSTDQLIDTVIEKERRFESFSGIILAIFAALLAITNLGGSKFDSDKIIGTNEKTNVYAWYQSKSLKQDMLENQRDLIETLIQANVIEKNKHDVLNKMMTALNSRIESYGKEKKELLLGSKKVGKDNWAQEKNGEYGKIIGALEWERIIGQLGHAGSKFDVSVLFLELCLVIGAISLVMHNERLRIIFIAAMITLGLIGMLYGIQAFILAISNQ